MKSLIVLSNNHLNILKKNNHNHKIPNIQHFSMKHIKNVYIQRNQIISKSN